MTYDEYCKAQFELNPQVMAFAIDNNDDVYGYTDTPKMHPSDGVWVLIGNLAFRGQVRHLTEVPTWDKSLRTREPAVRRYEVHKDTDDEWRVRMGGTVRALSTAISFAGYLGIKAPDGTVYRSLDHMAEVLGLPLNLENCKVLFQ